MLKEISSSEDVLANLHAQLILKQKTLKSMTYCFRGHSYSNSLIEIFKQSKRNLLDVPKDCVGTYIYASGN